MNAAKPRARQQGDDGQTGPSVGQLPPPLVIGWEIFDQVQIILSRRGAEHAEHSLTAEDRICRLRRRMPSPRLFPGYNPNATPAKRLKVLTNEIGPAC